MSETDPSKIVVELWWEGANLHNIMADGKHWVYENAVITGHHMESGNQDVLKIEPVDIVCKPAE